MFTSKGVAAEWKQVCLVRSQESGTGWARLDGWRKEGGIPAGQSVCGGRTSQCTCVSGRANTGRPNNSFNMKCSYDVCSSWEKSSGK